jgi:hypothetical protein
MHLLLDKEYLIIALVDERKIYLVVLVVVLIVCVGVQDQHKYPPVQDILILVINQH